MSVCHYLYEVFGNVNGEIREDRDGVDRVIVFVNRVLDL